MSYISVIDFFLVFPYLALFYIFARKFAKKIDPELRRHFMAAFWLRMFGCIAYTMVIQFYYGYGDSMGYYHGGDFITSGIMENTANARYLFAPVTEISAWYNASPVKDEIFASYFAQPSGNLVMKISSFLSFFSFNRFLIISLFFGFFSTLGQWKLFSVFDDINKHRNRKMLALAVLYTPSIWFWGSGLMKDSLCLGASGYIIYFIYHLFAKKEFSLKQCLLVVALALMVSTVKFYVLGVLLFALGLTALLVIFKSLKNVIAKLGFLLFLMIAVGIIFTQIDVPSLINSAIEDAVAQVKNFQNAYEIASADDDSSKGAFSIGEIDPSLSGILSRAPGVVFSTFFRPFVWESRKVMIFFTALESFALMLFTIYILFKTKLVFFFKAIFVNEFIFFSFVYSILFALVIGFTTFNFGTMVRYKIIFLPFLYFMLVYIYTNYIQKKPGEKQAVKNT